MASSRGRKEGRKACVEYWRCWVAPMTPRPKGLGLKHRGPDWSGLYQHDDCFIAHQRLAIVDPASGDQPLYNEDKSIVVAYEEHGENFVDMLDGMFSFVLLDTHDNSFISARDGIGITPLYIGWGLEGNR
ncbi:hypothetical protein OSB04_021058 [Centaurea solstitialis]|uniref:Glutamine amidotransferase type-2 domain-containing protein n=1 Tax=Centaurea solstitialis TaxID=347529 RepID=A0AA38T5L3_9ASTR|nr:hypothetical protein OSB04_021058 [Centaurea solstitialis]